MNLIFKKFSKNEQGIALIFALSMLALLLVMALAFTTNSMFERKVAINSSRGSSSRLLAQSVVQQLQVIIGAYSSDEVKCTKGIIDVLNAAGTGTVANQPTYDMLDHLTTRDGNITLFQWNSSMNNISWQYVKSDTSASSPIIGRYAFVIQPAYGLDANYLMKSGVDENGYNEERIGQVYNEMNVRSISEADIDPSLAYDFNYLADGGTFPGDWINFSTMFDAAHLNITDGSLQAKFRKWFVIGASESKEAMWFDVVEDSATAPATELFNRFNLNRPGGQWTVFGNTYPPNTMYDQILLDQLPATRDGVPDAIPTIWNNASNDGEGIPWLAFAGYKSDGTPDTDWGETFGKDAAGVIARRRQIAANLVDYSDSNSKSTSNINPANWWTTAPTFTGNEKTAYINEVIVNVTYKLTTAGPAASSPLYTHVLTRQVNVTIEAINIYGTLPSTSYNYSYSTSLGGYTAKPMTITALKGYSAATTVLPSSPAVIVYNDAAVFSMPVGNFDINLNKIMLNDGSNNIDYVNFGGYTIHVPARNISSGDTVTFSKSLSCKDPRQNINANGDDLDWKNNLPWGVVDTSIAADDVASNAGVAGPDGNINFGDAQFKAHATLGTSNYQCDPLYAYDPAGDGSNAGATVADRETASDQKDVSTAYIRNDSIESAWEIGFIHRGAPYQTINLTEYDPNKAVKYVTGSPDIMPGAGKFSDSANGGGDANILNQIKMIDASRMKKLNINTQYVDPDSGKNFVLQALLNKIRMGTAPASMATGGTHIIEVPNPELDNLITAIVNRTSGINYLTRAEVANCKLNSSDTTFALSNGTCGIAQTTNAMQEELIGKFINLTDVAGTAEYFNVIVLAQTIKDVGDGVKLNLNGTIVTTKFGQFDFRLDGGKYYYADEVTSEQKIKVLLHLNGTQCEILRYEYIE